MALKRIRLDELAVLALAAALALPQTVLGQSSQEAAWPSRPVRLVVPWGPGGSPDLVTRLLMAKVGEQTSASFIVDNRPGANGNIGTEMVKKADPDGYTFLVGTAGPLAINPHLFSSLPFDPIKDFSPVVLAVRFPLLLGVNASVPAHTVAELIALAKAQPGKLNYGSAGIGAAGHVIASSFLRQAGVEATHVPYKGPTIQALLAGDVQFVIDGLPTFSVYLKSGRVRALAVTTLDRSPSRPDIPTIAESGFPGFDFSAWILLLAPAGTPSSVNERLAGHVNAALKDGRVAARLREMGATIVGGTPAQALAFHRAEYSKWRDAVRASGAKVE